MFDRGPLVTVYVPCRNYGAYLGQAFESVRTQLYPNWQLFIIDEGSEDDTADVAASLERQDPERVRFVRHPEALGLQRTANEILGLAAGKYIVRLDADDWFTESALLLMVAKLESDPSLGLVYGNYYYTNQSGEIIGMERRRTLGVEDVSNHLPPHGACTMVRTRLLKAVGGYSEEVDAQDGWDLWFKLASKSNASSIDAPLFHYRRHTASLSTDSNRLLDAQTRILKKARAGFEGSYRPTCLAVIPVRESYPNFEGVPYRELGGRSLLEIAVAAAQSSSGVTRVAVSSESDRVLQFARALAEKDLVEEHIQVARPLELSGSPIKMREILMHAGRQYLDESGAFPDIVAFLSLHAPLRRSVHIDKALDTLRVTNSDAVVSVCEESEPIFSHGRMGLELLNPGRFDELPLERERLYQFNGGVLAIWSDVLAAGSLFGESISYVQMSKDESIQIKRPADLAGLQARFEELV